jgi:hypothetical protein
MESILQLRPFVKNTKSRLKFGHLCVQLYHHALGAAAVRFAIDHHRVVALIDFVPIA